ncbi:DNA fragmentation factor subunit alpha [Brachionichthys hirsutus]|uniref:DNA fragmentation factor subunit alpha n=1 Tax=Brachionichthys hirsutus TaxID=412623 RepID=UPI00360435B9
MTDGKPCKVCNFTRQKSYGLAVPSLSELRVKGGEFLGISPADPITVVLEDDGTIVADDAYFLCLPLNTKFMLLHERETWSPVRRMDGGTAWVARNSMLVEEADSVDASISEAPWWGLAQSLKQDLASVILMSEEDLQRIVDVPCSELAAALGFHDKRAQDLQETLQRVLDRREEERQSKELLQLYLKAMEKEDGQQEEPARPSQEGLGDAESDGVEVDSASGFTSRTLMVLKGKTNPESRLSTEDLQMVVTRGVEAMEQVLSWDNNKTSVLLEACEAELTRRLKQFQDVQSIRRSASLDGSRQCTEKSTVRSEESPAQGSD